MMKIRQIRLIKSAERNEQQSTNVGKPPTKAAAARHSTESVEQRAAVAIVTRWVSELRQRKAAEAIRSYKNLFHEAA